MKPTPSGTFSPIQHWPDKAITKAAINSLIIGGLCFVNGVLADMNQGWNHYGGSEKGLQYSAANLIHGGNVNTLTEVWRFRTGELGVGSKNGYSFQANPILARGKMYLPTGSGIIIAIDPKNGREIWRYDPKLDRSKNTAESANRGVSSWIDPTRSESDPCYHRIFSGTLDGRLIAVDGDTSKPCLDFGTNGQVNLSKDVRLQTSEQFNYGVTSPPVIVDDTIVVGSAIGDNRGVELELGIVRGLDVRNGTQRWHFDPIPRSSDNPMHKGWQTEQAKKTGAANAWAPLAADSKLGLVYVPTGSASPDHYGGERLGNNRYANSLVALEAATGNIIWHQQLVHHDVWDYDLPAQPTLANLKRNGKTIPAVIQATKMGLLFTFHRLTGEPIFDIEERPVPQTDVPGEQLAKTQPFPVAPPPLMSHAPLTSGDAFGFMLFDKWLCGRQLDSLKSEGIYTPPSMQGTVMMPAYSGGINWGGLAFDPEQQIAVTSTMEIAAVVQLIDREQFNRPEYTEAYPDSYFAEQHGTPYILRREVMLSVLGAPCSKPPWGRLSAVDMTSGKILWQVPLGSTDGLAPSFLPSLDIGVPGMGGPIVTAGGLIFIAATADNHLRAFNAKTGDELWKSKLPAGGQATPMAYVIDGKQYIVIAAGGHSVMGTPLGDFVIAYSL